MSETIQFKYDREKLGNLAHSRGYNSIQAYLEALIAEDEEEPELGESMREALIEMKEQRAKPYTSFADILNESD